MLIRELLQYIGDNITDLTYDNVGTTGNLFEEVLPQTPDLAVMAESTGGYPKDMRNTKYSLGTVRFIVRGTQNATQAQQIATDIITLIGSFGSDYFVPDGLRIVSCQAIQGLPINIGRDGEGRHRFSINFDIEIQEV